MREVVISYTDVKLYIKSNCDTAVDSILDSVEPFVMDYVKHPFGYAETDSLHDIDVVMAQIRENFNFLSWEPDGRVRRGLISRTIKTEQERWKKDRNAWFYGRFIGRLAYLMNQNVLKMSNK